MPSEHAKSVTVLVNEQEVTLPKERTTGREIKQAAIAAGVSIQLDFVLSVELGERRSRVVGDDDEIQLHKNQRFIAVAPDDNS